MSEEKNEESVIEFDKSGFNDYYKEMQSQIKDKVINKLLDQVQQWAMDNQKLKNENIMLKKQLTYILKRIIINKSEYSSNNNYGGGYGFGKKSSSTNMRKIMNNSVIVNHDNIHGSNNSLLKPLRSIENYRCVNNENRFRCSTEINLLEDDYATTNNRKKDKNTINMDNKVSGYLNSLYRNNFSSSNNNGLSNNYFLNKKDSLFDELFINNKRKITDESDNNGRNSSINSSQRRVNSSVGRRGSGKKGYKGNYAKGNDNYIRINKNKNISGGNGNKYIDFNGNKKGIKYYSTVNNPPSSSKASINTSTRSKKPYVTTKRNPYLANKF